MTKAAVPTYSSTVKTETGKIKYPAIAEIPVGGHFFVDCKNFAEKLKLGKYLYKYGQTHEKRFSWRTQNGPLVRITRTA